MKLPVTRFAPSPTGFIHIGNARPALMNWLFARRQGGRFILRFDDTDTARSREEYARATQDDLAWLGIVPDAVYRQSERLALYDAAADTLRAAGRLYACYETADELDRKRKRQQMRGLPPVYDRAALDLTADERAAFEAQGRKPHWRFKLDRTTIAWSDLVRGACHIDCASLSDPVLQREDGTYLYTLTSVVDDIDMGVTHVIRGEDHVTNTAVQIQIAAALSGASFVFAHGNLLTTADGEGLSKRSGALSLRSLRAAGVEPLAVAALAVLTGTSEAVRPVVSLDDLGASFELANVSRAPARFDPAELAALSARTLHVMPYAAVQERLAALVSPMAPERAEAFWLAVRGNLSTFEDARDWHAVIDGDITPVIEDADFLAHAARLLPDAPWGPQTWGAWTAAVKTATGRKGRGLFHPLRLALTARDAGPELAALLPLIGKAKATARLCGSDASFRPAASGF